MLTSCNVAQDSADVMLFNVEIYGDEDVTDLQQSIRESGWVKPLTVTPAETTGYYIVVAGHRRKRVAKKEGYTKLPVVIEVFASPEAVVERLLRENENRGKTPEQQIREGMTWEPIEIEKAEKQRLANLKQGDETPERENFPAREDGRVRDIIARRVGLGSGVTYEKGIVHHGALSPTFRALSSLQMSTTDSFPPVC